ncbi:hypothetical protein ACFSTE_21740 [Aquimarina hainanensis]|uniref:Uncharacterized protein n=1 Tax=Aquimarina hainanensis TaxID=1578017 RepID=A0ABW5NGD5_9FLAO
MKTISITIISLLISCTIFSQKRAIKITHHILQKEIIIKENKRIKIKTTGGDKISGRFKIENNSIIIKGTQIEISDIETIKRNPLLLSILITGLFTYGGALMLGFGALIGALVNPSAFLLAIPATGMIYIGAKSPNFNRKFKRDKNWRVEIITPSI